MLGKPGPKPNNKSDNNVMQIDTPQRNSRAYSIARVQRKCDADTVAAVMSGEMSTNAALLNEWHPGPGGGGCNHWNLRRHETARQLSACFGNVCWRLLAAAR